MASERSRMTLALFDFDGTLSKRDTLLDFLFFSTNPLNLLLGGLLLSPWLLAYLVGLQDNRKTKQRVIQHFFKQYSLPVFNQLCRDYAAQQLDYIIRPAAREKLHWHQQQGHRVIVVSASIENYLLPWCEHQHVELLATRLEINSSQQLTGNFLGNNCHGQEKVLRIQQHLNLQEYGRIHAYGDSRGDREMLALSDEAHFKPFR